MQQSKTPVRQNLPANPSRNPQTGVATPTPAARQFMPAPEQWAQIKEMGLAAFKSGMLPGAIRSGEAAAIVALKAFELGIPLMEGYAHIHVIDGKPTLSREMMQTLVMQNISGAKIEVLETNDKRAVVRGSRPGIQHLTITFTIEDAQRAQLMGKDNWKKYPAAMLLNRASTTLFRAYFPDGLRGVSYTAEELEPSIPTTGRHVEQSEPIPEPKPREVEPSIPTVLPPEPHEPAPGDFSAASSTHVGSEDQHGGQSHPEGEEPRGPGQPTQAMLKRLFTIATNSGWGHDHVKAYMMARWRFDSTKDLTREQYDALVKAIQDQSYREARAWLIANGIANEGMLKP